MTSVAGGGDDRLEQDYIAPSPAATDERIAVEYYNPSLDHYFITAEPAEAAHARCGHHRSRVAAHRLQLHRCAPAGRPAWSVRLPIFGTPGIGPTLAFLHDRSRRVRQSEGESVLDVRGIAFNSEAPVNADCAIDRVPVVRLYNNGKGGQASPPLS